MEVSLLPHCFLDFPLKPKTVLHRFVQAVIDALSQYLPANRAGLTPFAMTGLRLRTGFKPVEIFRKYLWYLLRERKFDQEAVDDVLALRTALGLTEDQVSCGDSSTGWLIVFVWSKGCLHRAHCFMLSKQFRWKTSSLM